MKDFERYRNPEEFSNPFFVIVHPLSLNEGLEAGLNGDLMIRISRELDQIRFNYDFVEMKKWPPQIIPVGVPRKRPILVCGFFDNFCVQDQRDSLRSHGYEAYISKRGTF